MIPQKKHTYGTDIPFNNTLLISFLDKIYSKLFKENLHRYRIENKKERVVSLAKDLTAPFTFYAELYDFKKRTKRTNIRQKKESKKTTPNAQ